MSKIRFETGQVVNFDGTPTPADIEEVANKLGINKPAQAQAPKTGTDTALPALGTTVNAIGSVIGQPFVSSQVNTNVAKTSDLINQAKKLPRGSQQRRDLLNKAAGLSNALNTFAEKNYQDMPTKTEAGFGIAGTALDVGTLLLGLGPTEELASAPGLIEGGTSAIDQAILRYLPNAVKTIGLGYASDITNKFSQGKKAEEAFTPGANTAAATALAALPPLLDLGKYAYENFSAADIKDTISGKLFGRPTEDILATDPKDVYKLPPEEQRIYYSNQEQNVSSEAKAAKTALASEQSAKLDGINQEAENLNKQLQTASRDEVLRLRKPALKGFAEASQNYSALAEQGLAAKGDTPVDKIQLNSFIDNQFPDNPDQAQAFKVKLGTVDVVNQTKVPGMIEDPYAQQPSKSLTLRDIYDQAKGLRQEISKSARAGASVYTSDQKFTDDAVNLLFKFMKENGVDLSEANSFWAKYAPIRDQIISEFRPFNQAGTQTKSGATTLLKVAQGKDVNNENFIKAFEDLTGQKIGEDLKAILSKIDETDKAKIAVDLETQIKEAAIEASKQATLNGLKAQARDDFIKSNIRRLIPKAIKHALGIGLGIFGYESLKKYIPLP